METPHSPSLQQLWILWQHRRWNRWKTIWKRPDILTTTPTSTDTKCPHQGLRLKFGTRDKQTQKLYFSVKIENRRTNVSFLDILWMFDLTKHWQLLAFETSLPSLFLISMDKISLCNDDDEVSNSVANSRRYAQSWSSFSVCHFITFITEMSQQLLGGLWLNLAQNHLVQSGPFGIK